MLTRTDRALLMGDQKQEGDKKTKLTANLLKLKARLCPHRYHQSMGKEEHKKRGLLAKEQKDEISKPYSQNYPEVPQYWGI